MNDNTYLQKQDAIDLANGLLLAQTKGTYVSSFRNLVENPHFASLPLSAKAEALREYAHLEDQGGYRKDVNANPSIPKEILRASVPTLTGAGKAAGLSALAAAAVSPKLMTSIVSQKPESIARVMKVIRGRYLPPIAAAAGIGGVLAAISEAKIIREERKHMNDLRESLRVIRESEHPQPLLNALMLSNRANIKGAADVRSKLQEADESREGMANNVVGFIPRVVPTVSEAATSIMKSGIPG